MRFQKFLFTLLSCLCMGLVFTGCDTEGDDDDDKPYGVGSFTYGDNDYDIYTGTLTYQGVTNNYHTFDLVLPNSQSTFLAFRIYASGATLTSGTYSEGVGVGKFSPGSYVKAGGIEKKLTTGLLILTSGSVYTISISCKDADGNDVRGSYMGELNFKDNSGTGPGPTPEPEPKPGDPIEDVEGNVYKTVIIGNMTWMAENLKTTKYNDGTDIPVATGGSNDIFDPRYSWYNNDSKLGEVYGALYNYYAVNTKKLCPTGWHAPSSSEWSALIDLAGGFLIAGDKLKEKGNAHWQKDSNSNSTDEFGFTALPGGCWMEYFSYHELGKTANWWTTTPSSEMIRMVVMGYNNPSVSEAIGFWENRYSVRCVKDK